eukprot:126790-Pleurochrysis_carterae.AAC.3
MGLGRSEETLQLVSTSAALMGGGGAGRGASCQLALGLVPDTDKSTTGTYLVLSRMHMWDSGSTWDDFTL